MLFVVFALCLGLASATTESIARVLSDDVILENSQRKDRYVIVQNLRVHYREVGRGPTVVMLHGNAGSVDDFDFGAVRLLSSSIE